MRKRFKEHFILTDKEFNKLWNESIFIFDTNCLLNFYRYTDETVVQYKKVFDKIEERLWIPYIVGEEFFRNRYSTINAEIQQYNDIINQINTLVDNIKNILKKDRTHISVDNNKCKPFYKEAKKLVKQLDDNKNDYSKVLHKDGILDFICNMYEGKVGEPLEKEKLEDLFEEGYTRYHENIPPGYKDKNSKSNKLSNYKNLSFQDKYELFGDYLIWYSVLEKAKKDKISVILVTNDTKEDWWKENKGETISARPELYKEFYKYVENNDKEQLIYIYKPSQFLKYANYYLNDVNIEQEAIDEVERVRDKDMLNHKNLTYRSSEEEIINNPEIYFSMREEYYEKFLSKLKEIRKNLNHSLNYKESQLSNHTEKTLVKSYKKNEDLLNSINNMVTSFEFMLKNAKLIYKDINELIVLEFELAGNIFEDSFIYSEMRSLRKRLTITTRNLDSIINDFNKEKHGSSLW